jgi:hypothetical protein
MRVAPKAQAAEFAANILPIIRMTGIGPVAVRCPRVPDRVDEGSERIRFSSAILPPYARRSKSLEVLVASSVEKLFLYAVDEIYRSSAHAPIAGAPAVERKLD